MDTVSAQQNPAKEAVFKMPKDRDVFFKNYCYTGTSYLQLQRSGAYRRIGREHMFVEEIDHGAWVQGSAGEITLFSQEHKYPGDPETNPFHITPFAYRGTVFLLWKDSETPVNRDLTEIKKTIDARTGSRQAAYVYVAIDRKTFENESGRTQDFIFHPELNKRDGQK